MERLFCTIGFADKTAEGFFGLLGNAAAKQLIDIRQNRGGQLSGFAKHPNLSFLLSSIGNSEYAYEPLLAPPPELEKTYRKTKDWPAHETAFLGAMKGRGVPEKVNTGSWASKVVFFSGEVVRDLPVVDRDWLDFTGAALAEYRGANRAARLERFLNSQFRYKIMSCPHHFVRIGLTRRYREVCWLMLDTLFRIAKADWLEEF
jgi:hypothetical protein